MLMLLTTLMLAGLAISITSILFVVPLFTAKSLFVVGSKVNPNKLRIMQMHNTMELSLLEFHHNLFKSFSIQDRPIYGFQKLDVLIVETHSLEKNTSMIIKRLLPTKKMGRILKFNTAVDPSLASSLWIVSHWQMIWSFPNNDLQKLAMQAVWAWLMLWENLMEF